MELDMRKSSAVHHLGSENGGSPPLSPTESHHHGLDNGLHPTLAIDAPLPSVTSSWRHCTKKCDYRIQGPDKPSLMSAFPNRCNIRHHRVHSEIVTLPEPEIIRKGKFSANGVDVGASAGGDGKSPSLSDENNDEEEEIVSIYMKLDNLTYSSSSAATASMPSSLSYPAASEGLQGQQLHLNVSSSNSRVDARVVRHQHSMSLDETFFIKPDELIVSPVSPQPQPRRIVPPAELAQLSLMDPKRAKRIIANRQSAARSKQRRLRYIAELEQELQALEAETTTLSANLVISETMRNAAAIENSQLKAGVQNMEQKCNMLNAETDSLVEELKCLKLIAGESFDGFPYKLASKCHPM